MMKTMNAQLPFGVTLSSESDERRPTASFVVAVAILVGLCVVLDPVELLRAYPCNEAGILTFLVEEDELGASNKRLLVL